jgi:antitoxin VapB
MTGMALSIKDPETDRLARELARRTGESLTEAIKRALAERLRRVSGRASPSRLRDELRAIRNRASRLPVLDPRSPDEVLGYDEHGLPR